jgi:hypothetical protein
MAVTEPVAREEFRHWLALQPRSWSVVIAMRAALRVLPLIAGDKIRARTAETFMLPVFRAIAISRFAAVCPNREIDANDVASVDAVAGAATSAASDAVYADAHIAAHTALTVYASDAASAAVNAVATAISADASGVATAIWNDVSVLKDGRWTPEQLGHAGLWLTGIADRPRKIADAWAKMSAQLRGLGNHWQVWIAWYDEVLEGSPPAQRRSEEWEMAFTDVGEPLPWDDLAAAVNEEIAARLRRLREAAPLSSKLPEKERILADLADIASPQPFQTIDGTIDAGPNPIYDKPSAANPDLPTLPLRQLNLISNILSGLPRQAPKHLMSALHSYAAELRAHGVQPILGILKDNNDIIFAEVHAPRAEDEWLEPGGRKAFDLLAANHADFLQHFPLDLKREALYSGISVDEDEAVGAKLKEPIASVGKLIASARQAGLVTANLHLVFGKMEEVADVAATQPPAQAFNAAEHRTNSNEIRIDPADRPVSIKKRSILSILGFLERMYNLAGSSVTITQSGMASQILETLKSAIDALSSFIR